MNWKKEWKALVVIVGGFLAAYHLPVGRERFDRALVEAVALVKWYAQEHVLLCLVPAFFIAGAIAVFVRQASVMKYLGAKANKVLAYGVASVSGSILAVCSCTVLPLFAGIYRMGAGLGPATAFLYSGPAINVLAIVLTAAVLGPSLGIARAVGAIGFSIVIGLVMHLIYRREEQAKAAAQADLPTPEAGRPLWKTAGYFGLMVGILVFANWGAPREFRVTTTDGATITGVVTGGDGAGPDVPVLLKVTDGPGRGTEMALAPAQIASRTPVPGIATSVWRLRWHITGGLAALFALVLATWFGLRWWKVAAVGVPVAILAVLFHEVPMIPFAAAVVGLSVITSTRKDETGDWFAATWGFAKQILPLLFFGVLISGALLGRPGHEGLIPSSWVAAAVGGNSLRANLLSSVVGASMYFATLTEVPIVQGLIGSGMGKGPALALLLAGPALSLPSMLVIRSIMGTQKTVVYCSLVVVMATITGMIYGALA